MQRLSLLILAFLISFSLIKPSTLTAQQLVDAEYIGLVGKILIDINLVQLGVNRTVENDVDVYKIRYTTKTIDGAIDTASGQLVVPVFRDKNMPLLVYQHGTVGDRNSVPSNFNLGNTNESQIALIYASFGYLTLAPDYIGLGDSKGFHPYIHAESEAWAAIDMISAVKEFAQMEGIALNEQLFVTGYSQGGHAAMAAHKVLQRDYSDIHPVTASAPMSGPYNVYGSMIDFTLSDQPYDLVAYLAWVALAYQTIYPGFPSLDELDQYFKPQYISDILEFRNEEIDLWTLNERLRDRLISEEGASVPKHMLQDSIVESLINDPGHPISLALQDNNLYDWVPDTPLRMYYCKADEQVYFKNSTFTDSLMNANGAADVASENLGDNLDHGGCVIPAVEASLDFFNSLKDISLISSNAKVDLREIATIYPNPSANHINIEAIEQEILDANIYSLSGQRLAHYRMPQGSINISSLPDGMYLLSLTTTSKIATTKIVIAH